MSLSRVLNDIGYQVRTAENGLSALIEIRSEIPDLLLTDLNMPGMSGFVLIGVVRRRFPAIPVIAMSGAFFGNEVPSGVNADAFYPKGSDVHSLLRIIESLAPLKRILPSSPVPDVPVFIQRNGHDASREPCVMVTCPE
jgi:CheY-like chemotaxis protein